MPPEAFIRPAQATDFDALVEVGRRSWLSAFAQTAPFELIAWWAGGNRTHVYYTECWQRMHALLIEDQIVALVDPKEDEINGLWVHPAHQGRGFGTLLLHEGERLIAEVGHDRAWLICSAFNPRARAFYERRGYVETARNDYVHRSGVPVQDFRMERRLGP